MPQGILYTGAVLVFRPGDGPVAHLLEGLEAVPRHEDVLDLQRLAAGALQAHHVPVVDDLVVADRDQEAAEVHRPAVLDHRTADERPGGMVTAGRPAPRAVDDVAAVGHHAGAHRGVRGGDPHGRILAPDVLLGLLLEVGQVPVVHTEDARRPTGRPAGAGQPAHRLEEQRRVALQAAPLLGLDELEEADLVELGDGRVGNPAQVLGLLGPLAQIREQFIDAGQDRLRVALLNGRHCKPPRSALLDPRLEHVTICVEQRDPAAGGAMDCDFCNLF